MACLPLLIGHAVNMPARRIAVESNAGTGSRLLHPVGQAIATEAGEVHQIDVLNVAALAQMLDQPPKRRGLQFRPCPVVELGHGLRLPREESWRAQLPWQGYAQAVHPIQLR